MAGIELDAKFAKTEGELEAISPLAKGLVLKICRPLPSSEAAATTTVNQSNAILRTLAGAKPDSLLYGKTDFESAQVRLSFEVALFCDLFRPTLSHGRGCAILSLRGVGLVWHFVLFPHLYSEVTLPIVPPTSRSLPISLVYVCSFRIPPLSSNHHPVV